MSERAESRKLVIIGDGNTGKSSLLDIFEKGEYVEMPYHRPTVIHKRNSLKRMKHPTLEGVEITLEL